MKNLWNEGEARTAKDPIDLLVYRSRLIGSEPSLCVWGGGNTSVKWVFQDHCGRVRRALFIKGSGSDLKTCGRRDFPPVDLDELLYLRNRRAMSDEEMVDYVSRSLLYPNAPRPSIEALLHAFLDFFPAIDHTHADAILSVTNTRGGQALARKIFGDELIWIPYVKPGFTLAKIVYGAWRRRPNAKGAVLEKHGLITWGENAKTSYSRTIEMVNRAERFAAHAVKKKGRVFPPAFKTLPPVERAEWLSNYLPVIRKAVSRNQKQALVLSDSADVLEFVNGVDAGHISQIGPATPDHMLRTKRLPLFVKVPGCASGRLKREELENQIERYAQNHERYFKRRRRALPKDVRNQMLDPYPKVILIPGIGMVTVGRGESEARIAAEIYRHSISVMKNAAALGGYESLSERLAFEIEYWPLELYKLSLAPKAPEFTGHVALVTGAARGIGRAIAESLASLGAHVFLSDLNGEAVTAESERINQKLARLHSGGQERKSALPLVMDVTDAESVRSGFETIVQRYGGIDFLVSNAGIAHVAPIDRLSLKDWEKSFAVNATGHFLAAREAVGILKRQGMGGAIVFIASKNVLAPGRDFGAYSAAKAAETQLARVLAIENGECGIRVNIVNPDGVFEDSGLWEKIGPDRANTYGVRADRLSEFYRRRNLMKTTVSPEDVAESVAFLLSKRSQKTTGCILTVDGGVKEAFPR